MNQVFSMRRWPLWAAACAALRSSRTLAASLTSGVLMEENEPRRLLAAPLSALPILHSHPTAPAKLFIDFNGDPGVPDWLGIDIPPTPAYDRDSDPTTYNNGEITNIKEIWQRVAEKYSPFNIDVTTQDPGNRDDNVTACIIVGGSYNDWLFAPAGGVATLGGFFVAGLSNTGFVFSENGVSTNKSAAEAIAHEAGHLFGLNHHSQYSKEGSFVQEYDPGNTQKAPIMGVAYYASRGLWAFALDNSQPDPFFQDDLAVLSGGANGFGFRPDDHGNTQFEADPLTGVNGTVSATGVIEQSSDVDVFAFTSPAGAIRFSVTPPSFGNMLDASLDIRDALGNSLAGLKDTVNWAETIQTTLPQAGTYYVYVLSHGNYGDLGQYELSGTLPKGVVGNTLTQLLVSGTDEDDVISVTLEDGAYKLDVNGAVRTLDPAGIGQFNILAGGGNDKVTIGTGVCKCYMLGGDGDDTLSGSEFSDTMTASAGNDQVFGFGGDDRLAGGPGRDILAGGNDRDRLYGDKGNDVLIGGAGVDRLYGGDDNDVLSGESSADKLYGEYGNDSLYGGNQADLLDGGVGLDQLFGGDDDDVLYARDQNFDTINGGSGFDKAQTETKDTQLDIEELLV